MPDILSGYIVNTTNPPEPSPETDDSGSPEDVSTRHKAGRPPRESAMEMCVVTMPPLEHHKDKKAGAPFDLSKSAVCDWLMAQPEVRQWFFNYIRDRDFILYDPSTGTWSGNPRGSKKAAGTVLDAATGWKSNWPAEWAVRDSFYLHEGPLPMKRWREIIEEMPHPPVGHWTMVAVARNLQARGLVIKVPGGYRLTAELNEEAAARAPKSEPSAAPAVAPMADSLPIADV
jgi:hypothetical protein